MITSISASMPAPVAAEPKHVGCALAAAVSAARSAVSSESNSSTTNASRVRRMLHRLDHAIRVGADAIDLVDEQHRRHAETLQRAHQDDRLRLHALDRRQHEHRSVEHRERPFDLGDEVGVAGCVDDVHGQVANGEGDDCGSDRDAALTFERQRVGLRRSLVDAAESVDRAGRVEQPFGEGRLTGVYMRQDPQVQRVQAFGPLAGQLPSGWTRTFDS